MYHPHQQLGVETVVEDMELSIISSAIIDVTNSDVT